MLQVDMNASLRTTSGKGAMRQLRMQGLTPAVVYGGGKDAVMLQLETKQLMAQLLKYYRYNTVVTLKIEGEGEKSVLIGEVQTDPVKDTLIHVDFFEIDLEKERAFTVPIVTEGTAKGVDLGGILMVTPGVVLKGKPLEIPDNVTAEVSDLDIGDKITCGEIAFPDNVALISDNDSVAISVVMAGKQASEEEVDEFEDEEAAPAEEPAATEEA